MLTLDSIVYIDVQASSIMDGNRIDRIRYCRVAYNILKNFRAFIPSLSGYACYWSTPLMDLWHNPYVQFPAYSRVTVSTSMCKYQRMDGEYPRAACSNFCLSVCKVKDSLTSLFSLGAMIDYLEMSARSLHYRVNLMSPSLHFLWFIGLQMGINRQNNKENTGGKKKE